MFPFWCFLRITLATLYVIVAKMFDIFTYTISKFSISFKAPLWFCKIYDRLYRISCVSCLRCFVVCSRRRTSLLTWQSSHFAHVFHALGILYFECEWFIYMVPCLIFTSFHAYCFLICADIGCHRFKHTLTLQSLLDIQKALVRFRSRGIFPMKIVFLLIIFKYSIRNCRVGGNRLGNRFVDAPHFGNCESHFLHSLTDNEQIAGLPVFNV